MRSLAQWQKPVPLLIHQEDLVRLPLCEMLTVRWGQPEQLKRLEHLKPLFCQEGPCLTFIFSFSKYLVSTCYGASLVYMMLHTPSSCGT